VWGLEHERDFFKGLFGRKFLYLALFVIKETYGIFGKKLHRHIQGDTAHVSSEKLHF
jgi:hypothetical protein